MRSVMKLASIGLCAVLAASSGPRTFAKAPETLQSLRKEKLAAAEEWWKWLVSQDEQAPVNPAEFRRAASAVKDAQLDLAANKQAQIQALKLYCDRMDDLYRTTDVHRRAGIATIGKLAEARYRLLEAQIWVKEEVAKP